MTEENMPQKNVPAQPGQPIEIVIEVSKEEDFKRFYAIGAIGVNNIYDFRVSFYNDDPELGQRNGVKKIQRKIGTEVILSPVAAKELARWLTQNVKDYETKFGEIKGQSGPRGNSKGTADSDSTVLDGYA
ncbi:hypothetical protein MmiAt1_17350 [Methanimicrococcus sp. At1]|uniref:DUF3467 domain-containing protein n=1 Tax=Methanimicrococcus hacksteinii TaxID=3028293 RepID=A0ABU3VS20_9EURY|nr:DUF3467 domain-containing protein [Methanimicrococcus sp. At1]MDV0446120.1 hypothetical protein [Methanimicrococcus sp. At1]